jgi:hypothetical protein
MNTQDIVRRLFVPKNPIVIGLISCEGLRLLKQRDEVWKADVRDRVKLGMNSIRAGRTVPAEQVQAEMTAFKKKWKKNRNLE